MRRVVISTILTLFFLSGLLGGCAVKKATTQASIVESQGEMTKQGQRTDSSKVMGVDSAVREGVDSLEAAALKESESKTEALRTEASGQEKEIPFEDEQQGVDTTKIVQREEMKADTAKKVSPVPVAVKEPEKKEIESKSEPKSKAEQQKAESKDEPKHVEFIADIMRPIKVGDSTAINLLGNVVFYHNGAVITCDSAVRYSEKRMECFNRVVINQKTTYVYGDRADYDGEINTARVYAPIIKMVDGDAIMYTYNFSFNTLDKIGIYSGGATMTQKDSHMESLRGYYYVDQREFVGVEQVELRNPEYMMRSDSAKYNLDTEVATFYVKSYIWNDKQEILSAEHGSYSNPTKDYVFTREAYIITKDQEIWADTIDYNSESENAILRRNVQLRDDDQKVIGFGDYGQYWGGQERGMLTLDPSLLSFDPQEPDTLYMRADSMFFFTFSRDTVFQTTITDANYMSGFIDGGELIGGQSGEFGDTERPLTPIGMMQGGGVMDSLATKSRVGALERGVDTERSESDNKQVGESAEKGEPQTMAESEKIGEEEAEGESGQKELTGREIKALERAEKKEARERERAQSAEQKAAQKEAQKEAQKAARDIKRGQISDHSSKKGQLGEGSLEGGGSAGDDSLNMQQGVGVPIDSTSTAASHLEPKLTQLDSLGQPIPVDSLVAGVGAEGAESEVKEEQDSVQRVIFGYRDVRIYRKDFQAVCDSLVGFAIDSTMHLYIEPVLWQEQNQVTAEIIDIYTDNQEIRKAIFRGDPFMASQVDSTRYNQVKGKLMKAYFSENEIYRHDVNGNGETYYYMEDDKEGELMGFLVATCADITFLIEDRQMNQIIYRGEPVYAIYPMDKIPPTQEQFLPGFKWEADRRPTKESVFSRVMRQSQREEYEAMEKPQFPLTDTIHKDKTRMIESRIWTERNDVLSVETEEFIRSVEHN